MEEKELLNLTSPQMNIYLREQHYYNSSINIISGYLIIQKKLSSEIFNQILNMVIKESDNLRIRITKGEDNQPYQYIEEYTYQEIPVIDLSDKTKDEVENIIYEKSKEPIEFYNSDLFQFIVYKIKNNSCIIYIKIHHIIADAWTFKLLSARILENYSKIIKGNKTLEIYSYKDSIKEESEYLKSNLFVKDQQYWEEYLKEVYEPAVLKDVSLTQNIQSIRIEKELSNDIYIKILKYCKENQISPYTFFLSIISVYLYKTTGKEKFTLGTPLLNRKNFQEKNTAGMYVSTIPLKVEVKGDTTFKDLCLMFSRDTRKALRHQRYPYMNMVEFVRKSNSNINSLFEVLVSFQNTQMGGTEDLRKVKYEWLYNEKQQAQFEFHITQYNEKKPFVLGFDFKKDIATEEERNLIVSRVLYLIENILNVNSKKVLQIDRLKYIPLKEIKKLNSIMYTTKEQRFVDKKSLIIKDRFEKQVQRTPNKIAVKYNKNFLTYKELNQKANALANQLIEKGIRPQEGVSLVLERSLDMAIAILGVIKSGAYFVPISMDWPYERVKHIIKDSNSKLLITSGDFLKNKYDVESLDIKTLLQTKNLIKSKTKNTQIKSNPNYLLYVLYTSGSTGLPKGVLISNENVAMFLNGMKKGYDLKDNDVWSMFHSYTFDVSMWEFFTPLTIGGTLVIVPDDIRVDAKKMLYFLRDEKITILSQTPSYFYKLVIQNDKEDLKVEELHLKYVILGGESVYANPIESWKKKYKDTKIMNGYRAY